MALLFLYLLTKHNMTKRYFYSVLLLISLSCPSLVMATGSLNSAIQKLDASLTKKLREQKLIGCAVAVVKDGETLFIKTYGYRKKGTKDPITPQTVFPLGSLSKPLVATLIAALQEQEFVSLDDTVSDSHAFLNPQTKLRDVLSHRTGYCRKGWNAKIESHTPRQAMLYDLAQVEQQTPGTSFDYHNFSFSLVQEFLEHKNIEGAKSFFLEKLNHCYQRKYN
jgi:CubicO group peptidase (beta-lactamase class C family)